MGTVYRAIDTVLERRVALKLVRTDRLGARTGRATIRDRLLREARAAATLQHENAVAIHDVGQEGETSFIAMELVAGRSLRSYIGDASVPLEMRVRWLRDVARALAAAHERGLVHRDIKPENVMVRHDRAVKVLDFGIACALGEVPPDAPPPASRGEMVENLRTTYTRDGVFVGTPRYMSPEQIQGAPVDGRADQFSWGVMAYEMLSGKPPWSGETASLSTLLDIVDAEAPPLREVASGVSAALEAIVTRALHKQASERFESMGDLVAALDRLLDARPGPRWTTLAVAGFAVAAIAVTGFALVERAMRSRAALPDTGSQSAKGALAGTSPVVPSMGPSPWPAPSADPPPAPWPDSPPQTVLRLDASRGIVRDGDRVSRWEDQSGLGNDAVAGRKAPTFVEHSAIAGFPALHFEQGACLVVADASSLQLGTYDFAVLAVLRYALAGEVGVVDYSVVTAYGMVFGKTNEDDPYVGPALFVSHPRPHNDDGRGESAFAQTAMDHMIQAPPNAFADGLPHLLAMRREGTTLEIRVDGDARQATVPLDEESAPGRPAYIGAQQKRHGVIQQFQGDLSELVVAEAPIDASAVARMESELAARFHLGHAGARADGGAR